MLSNSNNNVKHKIIEYFWHLTDNTFSYLAITLPLVLLLEISPVLFCLGVLIEVLIGEKRNRILVFITNLLPAVFLILPAINAAGLTIEKITLMIIICCFTFLNGVIQLFYSCSSTQRRLYINIFSQISRVIILIIIVQYLSSIQDIIEINESDYILFYISINSLVIIIVSLLSAVRSILINEELVKLSNRLEDISSWTFDKEIIKTKLIQGGDLKSKTERAIVIGDIRGFTNFTEKTEVSLVLSLLEQFFTKIEEIVLKYQGFKPEFIGDEFITYFSDTKTAIKCAIEIRNAVNPLLQKYQLGIGLGINRGVVVEGIIGSNESKKIHFDRECN